MWHDLHTCHALLTTQDEFAPVLRNPTTSSLTRVLVSKVTAYSPSCPLGCHHCTGTHPGLVPPSRIVWIHAQVRIAARHECWSREAEVANSRQRPGKSTEAEKGHDFVSARSEVKELTETAKNHSE